jgi:dTDP-4-dehydrorhamnose reductase
MRVLVTGAGGRVGSELGSRLAHHEVHALARADLDVADRDAVSAVVGELQPDAVISCAAWTDVDGCESDPDRAMTVNALGPRHLAVAAARAGAHLVHLSTDYVFPGDKDGPYHEWDDTGPLSVYGRSKLGGEIEIARHATSWTIIRTSWVIGHVGRDFVDTILERAESGAPLAVVTDQRGCPTYAPDLAATVARLTVGRHQGIFHVTNAEPCTWWDLACHAVELAGMDPGIVGRTTTAEFPRPARRPANSVLANTALAGSGLPRLRPWREALVDKVAIRAAGRR